MGDALGSYGRIGYSHITLRRAGLGPFLPAHSHKGGHRQLKWYEH